MKTFFQIVIYPDGHQNSPKLFSQGHHTECLKSVISPILKEMSTVRYNNYYSLLTSILNVKGVTIINIQDNYYSRSVYVNCYYEEDIVETDDKITIE